MKYLPFGDKMLLCDISTGSARLLTPAADRSTSCLEVVPMRGMEAATCADALVAGWISRFRVPAILTTDRGTQFSSVLWSLLCQRLGIRHVMTTSYHPQSNGLVERAHRQVKEALKARLAGNRWPDHLP
jgi:transposase InsO family protein